MKKYIVSIILIAISCCANAQIQTPVHWAYGLKKLTGGMAEVHVQATIDDGWHIYAQKQGPDFIGTRTSLVLAKVPGLVLIGIPAEIGRKEKYENKEVGITNYEYAKKVDFVQKVKLPPGIKEIKGFVNWQACTHKMCLGEDHLDFIIPVN